MGGRVKPMNDTEILKEMIVSDAQVPLQQEGLRRPSVQLTDAQSGTTVNIKGLPHDSVVIRAEDFEDSLTVFKGSKSERKRADFVIVCNDTKKWIICVEIHDSDHKGRSEIIEQLKGALCFVNYCKCIGKEFWLEKEFLDGYEYQFVYMAYASIDKRSTHPNTPRPLGLRPENYLKISGKSHHFSKLIQRIS